MAFLALVNIGPRAAAADVAPERRVGHRAEKNDFTAPQLRTTNTAAAPTAAIFAAETTACPASEASQRPPVVPTSPAALAAWRALPAICDRLPEARSALDATDSSPVLAPVLAFSTSPIAARVSEPIL